MEHMCRWHCDGHKPRRWSRLGAGNLQKWLRGGRAWGTNESDLKNTEMHVTFHNSGVHWEDRRSNRSCPNPGWCDFTGVAPTSYQWFPPNCLSGKYVHQPFSNQSSSGWDDDDRWSSEDEHNYEVGQYRQIDKYEEEHSNNRKLLGNYFRERFK